MLEAAALSGQELSLEDCWHRVLHGKTPEELQAPLHRLAALQGVLWLATNRLAAVEGLFRLLNGAQVMEQQSRAALCCYKGIARTFPLGEILGVFDHLVQRRFAVLQEAAGWPVPTFCKNLFHVF